MGGLGGGGGGVVFSSRRRHTRYWRDWSSDVCSSDPYTLPAFRPHPITGKEVWFNQALSHHASYLKVHPNFKDLDIRDDQYPFHTCYGDGTEFEPALLQHIREVSWSCARGYRWRTGDVLVLDNFAVMHSRLSFTGERRMVTSLTAN